MSYDNNPFNHPEKHGLVKVADADLSAPDYSYDMIAAWADAEGFYLGTDSGCSCPSPFEDYDGKSDMTGPLTAGQAIEEANSIRATSGYDPEGWEAFIAAISGYSSADY